MNELREDTSPFPADFKTTATFIDQGHEHASYRYAPNGQLYVVKQTLPSIREPLASMGETQADIFRRLPVHQMKQRDFLYMQEIFGPSLLHTDFIHGHSMDDGLPTNFVVQPYIDGTVLSDMNPEAHALLCHDQMFVEQLSNLVWSAKRVFQDIGSPPDLNYDNIILEHSSNNLYFFDPHSPTLLKMLVDDMTNPFWSYGINTRYIQKRLKDISQMEQSLFLSKDHKEELDVRYGINLDLQRRLQRHLRRQEASAFMKIPFQTYRNRSI